MDSIQVNISYRPIRIGWAIESNDFDAFRKATQYSYTMWGGKYNPILNVDNEQEADQLVALYHVDIIIPIGGSAKVIDFPKRYPHLHNPLEHHDLFTEEANDQIFATMLDINNLIAHHRNTPKWSLIKKRGFRIYDWQGDDPLSDAFHVQFGRLPIIEDTGIGYALNIARELENEVISIDLKSPLSSDCMQFPTIANLTEYGLTRNNHSRAGFNSPGFYLGSTRNFDDLVHYWNLQSADIPILFIDPDYLDRYSEIIPAWDKSLQIISSYENKFKQDMPVWSQLSDAVDIIGPMVTSELVPIAPSPHTWNGLNVTPPIVHLGRSTTLGVINYDYSQPRISFMLNDKPFQSDALYGSNHLVASLSIYNTDQDPEHTFNPPFIPELNEFYGRSMALQYDRLRSGTDTIDLIISATRTDLFLNALPVSKLFSQIFRMAGYNATKNRAGLIAQQLITQLGGLQGARVFKIPGVRRLLKTYGPTSPFTKSSAFQLIGEQDQKNPQAKFKDHENLYIEPRDGKEPLTPPVVFSYLVDKGLFRIGATLSCPTCRMDSWTPLDNLKQATVCDLCGSNYNATRQLIEGEFHYRRSGVLGAEKNAMGAVPVVLTLQQLDTNIDSGFRNNLYSSSLELKPKGTTKKPECEVDFIWLCSPNFSDKTVLILGECKDKGEIALAEFKNDLEGLRRVADTFPTKRFDTYILYAKLSPFTPEELEFAKTMDIIRERRTILLTDRELEPYDIFERAKHEFDIAEDGSSAEELAQATAKMYFSDDNINQDKSGD